MQRDPLGYVDGMSQYTYYAGMHGDVDPSGLDIGNQPGGQNDINKRTVGPPNINIGKDGFNTLNDPHYIDWTIEIFGITKSRFDWDVFNCSTGKSVKTIDPREKTEQFQEFYIKHSGKFLALWAGLGLRGEFSPSIKINDEAKELFIRFNKEKKRKKKERDAKRLELRDNIHNFLKRNDTWCNKGYMKIMIESREYGKLDFKNPAGKMGSGHGGEIQNVNRNYVRKYNGNVVPYTPTLGGKPYSNYRNKPAIWSSKKYTKSKKQWVKIDWSRCNNTNKNWIRVTYGGDGVNTKTITSKFPER